MQNLGRMGETYFNTICASEGITCNESHEDRAGWDYTLDFPAKFAGVNSADMIPAPIECKVQVKSTNKNNKFCAVTLINLLRFAKSTLPTFFIFIEYNNKRVPESLYLVHFDEEWIGKTLKRVRQVSQEQGSKKLNKTTMRISYNDCNKLPHVDGRDLKKSIQHFIPNGMDDYAMKKSSFAKTVGFEAGQGQMTFSTEDQSALLAMIESSLGVSKPIPVKNVRLSESRFGIELKQPLLEMSEGTLQISPGENYRDVEVRFKKSKYGSYLIFPCKLYFSPLNLLASKEFQRFRLESDFFDFMFGFGRTNSTYRFNIDKQYKIQDLKDRVELISWLWKQEGVVSVELILDKDHDKIANFDWDVKDAANTNGTDWALELLNIEKTQTVLKQFKVDNVLKVWAQEVSEKKEKIKRFSEVYSKKADEIIINFDVDEEYDNKFLPLTHCIVHVFSLNIGGVWMCSIVTLLGTAERLPDGQRRLNIHEKIIEKEFSALQDDEGFTDHIKGEVLSVKKKHYDDGCLLINIVNN